MLTSKKCVCDTDFASELMLIVNGFEVLMMGPHAGANIVYLISNSMVRVECKRDKTLYNANNLQLFYTALPTYCELVVCSTSDGTDYIPTNQQTASIARTNGQIILVDNSNLQLFCLGHMPWGKTSHELRI